MKRNDVIIILLGLFLLQACKKDLEKVPFKLTTNELTIKLDTLVYTVVTLDSLKIKPVITESKPEGHKFSYSWQVWPNLGDGEMEEISNEKDLNIKVVLAPKDYRFRFIAKDEVTGISYLVHGVIAVISPFNEGWLVTHNSGGKGHLGFIRTLDDKVYLSAIEDVNQKTYDEAISAYTASFAFNDSYMQGMFLTKTGAYRFDSQSFVELTDNQKLFFGGTSMSFNTTAGYGYDGRGGNQYIFNNGNLYGAIAADFFSGFNFTEKFSTRVPGDYTAFPYLFKFDNLGTSLGFYDNKNKKFRTTDGTLAITELTAATGLTGVGMKMIAADLGPSREYLCVMQNESNSKYYMFTFDGLTPTVTTSNVNHEMLNCPDLSTATCFTSSRSVRLLYYSSGNKIYMYDVNANAAKLVYAFPSGYTIKAMEMLKETFKQIEYTSSFHNKRIAVGVDHGIEGEVYYLDLNSVGEIANGTYSKKFTGFGQISHLNVKSPY